MLNHKGLTMRRTFFVISLLLMTACSSDPEVAKPQPPAPEPVAQPAPPPLPEPPTPQITEQPKTTDIEVNVNVAKTINPDLTGRPSPVVMRIYGLKSLGKFQSGDFYKLTTNYESFLGADLISSEQFYLHPGQNKIIKQTVVPETKYIAATVAFRDLNQAVWRASAPIETNKLNQFEINLTKLKVNIQ